MDREGVKEVSQGSQRTIVEENNKDADRQEDKKSDEVEVVDIKEDPQNEEPVFLMVKEDDGNHQGSQVPNNEENKEVSKGQALMISNGVEKIDSQEDRQNRDSEFLMQGKRRSVKVKVLEIEADISNVLSDKMPNSGQAQARQTKLREDKLKQIRLKINENKERKQMKIEENDQNKQNRNSSVKCKVDNIEKIQNQQKNIIKNKNQKLKKNKVQDGKNVAINTITKYLLPNYKPSDVKNKLEKKIYVGNPDDNYRGGGG